MYNNYVCAYYKNKENNNNRINFIFEVSLNVPMVFLGNKLWIKQKSKQPCVNFVIARQQRFASDVYLQIRKFS